MKALLNLGWNFHRPRWNFTETLLVQSWNCAGTRSGVPWGGSPEIIGGGYAGLIHALRACRGASRGPGYPLGLLEKRHGSYQTIARDDAAQQPRRGMRCLVLFRFAHGLGLQSVGSAAPVVTVESEPLNQPLTALKRFLRAVARNPNRNNQTGTAPNRGTTSPTAVPHNRRVSQPWRHSQPRSAA